MAAKKNSVPPPAADAAGAAKPARRELAWIETLFDRRRREKDRTTSYFWDGYEVLIVRGGKVARLAPIGVIRGPYLDEAQ
jgi:hypothetical protein